MDIFLKNKIYLLIIIALVLLNTIAMGAFWFIYLSSPKRPDMPPPMPGKFEKGPPIVQILEKELSLNPEQSKKLIELNEKFQNDSRAIKDSIRKNQEELYSFIFSPNFGKEAAQSKLKALNDSKGQLDNLTFDFMCNLKGLCNPDQQKKFEDILTQISNMIFSGKPEHERGHRPPMPPM